MRRYDSDTAVPKLETRMRSGRFLCVRIGQNNADDKAETDNDADIRHR